MKIETTHKFTKEDVTSCWDWGMDYFVDILNGETTIEVAREDLLSLIGSEYDRRVIKAKKEEK
jgi:hypothetical protein